MLLSKGRVDLDKLLVFLSKFLLFFPHCGDNYRRRFYFSSKNIVPTFNMSNMNTYASTVYYYFYLILFHFDFLFFIFIS
jgi:hypothetical protein